MIILELYATDAWTLDLNDHVKTATLDGFYPETATDPDNPVVETINVGVRGATLAELVGVVQEINRLLDYARLHPSGAEGVWLNFAADVDQEVYRARVTDGAVRYNAKLLRDWRTKKMTIGLIVERAPYWEGAETQIPLTNANDEDNITGLTVWNHNDATAGHENFVEIAAADVAGDLPAACRIEIENTYNNATRAYTYYIGQAWQSGWPGETTLNVLEAEDADYPTTGNSSNAGYSGGATKALALPATAGYIARWDLSTDVMTACKGQWFRLMAGFTSAPAAGTWIKMKLTFPAGSPLTVVAESPWMQMDGVNTLQEIGTLQIPPWLPGETNLSNLTLALYGYLAATGNQGLDYIQLFPMDGFRKLTPLGYGLGYQAKLIDDGIAGNLYADWGGEKSGYYVGTGEIKLQPGKAQRLYFLCTSQTGGSGIDRTGSVKMFYRPRRAGL